MSLAACAERRGSDGEESTTCVKIPLAAEDAPEGGVATRVEP